MQNESDESDLGFSPSGDASIGVWIRLNALPVAVDVVLAASLIAIQLQLFTSLSGEQDFHDRWLTQILAILWVGCFTALVRYRFGRDERLPWEYCDHNGRRRQHGDSLVARLMFRRVDSLIITKVVFAVGGLGALVWWFSG